MYIVSDDSLHKLEGLDPQKRVQLEARIMGRQGSEFSPDKNSRSSRKRGGNEDDSRPGKLVGVISMD